MTRYVAPLSGIAGCVLCGVTGDCPHSLTAAPDPRDARIAALEAALRELVDAVPGPEEDAAFQRAREVLR